MLIKGKDIVIVGLQPWYFEIGSNCKNIALEFAKYNRVLYVNTPLNRKTYYGKGHSEGLNYHISVGKKKAPAIKPIADNFWEFYPPSIIESIHWMPAGKAFNYINAINNRRYASDIKSAADALGFKDFLLFNDNDFLNGQDLKALLNPELYIYYSRDYLRGFSYWKKHGDQLEPEAIRKADVAVANSLYLKDYCANFNPRSYYVGQGCKLDLFNAAANYEQPELLKKLNGPVIGYVGALTSERLDIGVIENIARSNAAWQVVLVGPEDEQFQKSALHQLANVHFAGRKPMTELAAWMRYFDVCLNPQLLNETTVGNYPLKVDEYLAMGKPVVATYTKTMEIFSAHTYLAKAAAEYPELIARAMREDDAAKRLERIAFAQTHTWENCMQKIGDASNT